MEFRRVLFRPELQSHSHLVSRRRHTRRECDWSRSEEHTSELQSHSHLVCRLLLEKKKKQNKFSYYYASYLYIYHSTLTRCHISLRLLHIRRYHPPPSTSSHLFFFFFFFFNDTATTEIYTLSLHDALPI